MPRYVLGPSTQVTEQAIPPVPPPTGLAQDAALSIIATHPGGSLSVSVDTFDPTTTNSPTAVGAIYCPQASYPTDPTKVTPEFFMSGGFPQLFMPWVPNQGNGSFLIQVPNVGPGTYVIQTILEFAQ